MHYRADVYIDSVLRNSFIANSVEVLKVKAQPFIENEKVTHIEVSKVEDIGFFKLPAEIEKVIEKELLL